MRSAIWGGRLSLHRVTAIRADLPPTVDPGSLLVAAFARLVVVGGDGSRLHEEVIVGARAPPRVGPDASSSTAAGMGRSGPPSRRPSIR